MRLPLFPLPVVLLNMWAVSSAFQAHSGWGSPFMKTLSSS
jgi:hypothetical protein